MIARIVFRKLSVVFVTAIATMHCGSVPADTASFDRVWSAATLYSNDESKGLQELSLIGRYHGQYWYSESEGESDQDWENRRMFFGVEAKIADRFTFESQFAIAEDFDPFYDGLYVTFLEWERADGALSISGGRLDYLYTGLERSLSSKRLMTMERALLVNQLMPGEVVGLHTTGEGDQLSWQAGVFSGSIEDEFSRFDAGVAGVIGLAAPLPLFSQSGSVFLDYLYNDGNEENNAFEPYGDIVSLWHEGESGHWGLGLDLTWASGVGDISDVFGFTVLPSRLVGTDLLMAGDSLEVAMRYHYATSDKPGGLSFARRYEQPVTAGEGDRYQSIYLGTSYLIYQHKLKLMAGAEYFKMDGLQAEASGESSRDGWSIVAGLRLYF